MDHEDRDTPDITDSLSDTPQPPTPAEFCELTDAIQLTLLLLDEHPQIDSTEQWVVDPAANIAEMRKMWRIEDLRPQTELWLDEHGDIWRIHPGNPSEQERCTTRASLDIGRLWYLKAVVLSFMAQIAS